MEIILLQGIVHMEIHYCFPLKKVKIVYKVRMGSLWKKKKYAEDFLVTISSKSIVKKLYHGREALFDENMR